MSLNSGVPSMRTMSIGLLGLGSTAVVRTMIMIKAGGVNGVAAVSDLGEFVVVAVAAAVVILVARRFEHGSGLRSQWTMIGVGMTAFALGDATWSFMELALEVDVPYPGMPDLFYVAEYVLICAALLMAAGSYRSLLDIRPAAGIAGTAGVVMVALLYVGLLEPYLLSDSQLSTPELVASVFYPVADVALLMVPGIFLLLVAAKLEAGRLGWPWWFVVVGATALAVSDTTFSWLAASNSYVAGSFVDYGWMLAHVAFAVCASLALDIVTPAAEFEAVLE
ncbi:MAG: hypothetical protein L6413_08485 [Coriobacteriia bacterium]|nr:hypothetical protein [Coriobacteriia bacterium]